MGILNKMKEPIFLKESSQVEAQISELKELKPLLNSEGQTIIKRDIKYLEYGMIGEKNIAFELKNSHMPMYILHDIYLEDEDLSAQIDYLVVTKKMCFIIECKNLYGDIEINSAGDFIRTIEFGNNKRKEGIYSPITQNQRHLELMKKIRSNRHQNKILRFMNEKYFHNLNKSIVVLANPKTVLNTKFAKKEDKDKVIRADQLIAYIRKIYSASKENESSDARLLKWAESYLKLHKEVEKDYTAKYKKYLVKVSNEQDEDQQDEGQQGYILNEVSVGEDVTQTDIFEELRQYRLLKSREEKIKPYIIYTNNQLKELIFNMPKTLQELGEVPGFGSVKVKKYGTDIIKIIGKHVS